MDKMRQLARDVGQLEEKLNECTRCGVCQSVCPLYRETRREADVCRGKLALIVGLIDKQFEDPKGVAERLERCLLCGSCAKGCPAGVSALEIFLFARGVIKRYLGLSFGEKLLFKQILANPGRFNTLTDTAASFQHLLFKRQDNVQATSCARFASPLLRHRNIVPLKKSAFHSRINERSLPSGAGGVRVAYFVGCLIDKAFPDVAFAVVEALSLFGARLYIPQTQGCCGMPSLASGDMDSFERLVRFNVDLFMEKKTDYIVTSCATCSAAIIKLWPALIKAPDLRERVLQLARKTVDISWLMARRFNVGPGKAQNGLTKDPVTCHDPCHLRKAFDIYEEPRRVVEAAGHPVIEMAAPDTCCGMGGSFNLKHYGLSSAIGMRKARQILDTGCKTVVTSCPACMIQLSDMLARCDAQVRVKHPVSLYVEALRQNRRADQPE